MTLKKTKTHRYNITIENYDTSKKSQIKPDSQEGKKHVYNIIIKSCDSSKWKVEENLTHRKGEMHLYNITTESYDSSKKSRKKPDS